MDDKLSEPPSLRKRLRFRRRLAFTTAIIAILITWYEVANLPIGAWAILAPAFWFSFGRNITPAFLYIAEVMDEAGLERTDIALIDSEQTSVTHFPFVDTVVVTSGAVQNLTRAALKERLQAEVEVYQRFRPFIQGASLPLAVASCYLPAIGLRHSPQAAGLGLLACIAVVAVLDFAFRRAKAKFLRERADPSL